jgi:hypothetical protein
MFLWSVFGGLAAMVGKGWGVFVVGLGLGSVLVTFVYFFYQACAIFDLCQHWIMILDIGFLGFCYMNLWVNYRVFT